MRSADLRTLRESLGLSIEWCTSNARKGDAPVHNRTWRHWEAGRNPVPKDIAKWITAMTGKVDMIVTQGVQFISDRKPEKVILIRYRTDEDLWRFRPDMRGFPTTYHVAILSRIRCDLWKLGIKSVVEYLEPDAYLTWLGDREDTEELRLVWASEQVTDDDE